MSPSLLEYNSFYLVGIKGVAMCSLAQCLLDMNKTVRGSDVVEDFVTQPLLDKLPIQIDHDFSKIITADCVIYTAAHGGPNNPQVVTARNTNIPTFSQAEALGVLFNQKKGIAVCGVGGKSTTSAMIAWILEKTGHNPSFSIGVGNIPGLEKTGQWSEQSEYFVAEADEYVVDPHAPDRGETITPRFSFLNPQITVCTNLLFDHPDVYKDFNHTLQVYTSFFSQLKTGGSFVFNYDNKAQLPPFVTANGLSFGTNKQANISYQYHVDQSKKGKSVASVFFNKKEYSLSLAIPGEFNIKNAIAALGAVSLIGISLKDAIAALSDFHSTMRRFEYIGEKDGVKYYDDYAHHPSEIIAAIQALKDWYPTNRKVIVFQAHTFSRTKQLFKEFVEALSTTDHIYLVDIFASAREAFDPSISADMLVDEIKRTSPHITVQNAKTIVQLEEYLRSDLKPGDVCLTLGAGDIYKLHHLL